MAWSAWSFGTMTESRSVARAAVIREARRIEPEAPMPGRPAARSSSLCNSSGGSVGALTRRTASTESPRRMGEGMRNAAEPGCIFSLTKVATGSSRGAEQLAASSTTASPHRIAGRHEHDTARPELGGGLPMYLNLPLRTLTRITRSLDCPADDRGLTLCITRGPGRRRAYVSTGRDRTDRRVDAHVSGRAFGRHRPVREVRG